AEHLRRGAQLDVRLDAEHRLEPGERLVVVHQRRSGHFAATSSGACASSGPPQRSSRARSTAAPTRYTRSSPRTGAMICSPAGSPSASPHGTEIAALPARLAGIVHRSARYIAIGSSARSPIGNAVVG